MNTLPEDFPVDEINKLISEYLPYHMVSMDFIQNIHNNKWYVVDINHSCSSWGEVQEKNGTTEESIFEFAISQLENISTNIQRQRYNNIDNLLSSFENNITSHNQ